MRKVAAGDYTHSAAVKREKFDGNDGNFCVSQRPGASATKAPLRARPRCNVANPMERQTRNRYNGCMPQLATECDLLESDADNTPGGLRALLRANEKYRAQAWPKPFRHTTHRIRLGDAREMAWLADESVHLVVTSPPYWTLKEYVRNAGQLGHVEDYEAFLCELDKAWRECARVLVPGGRICCVVGDVCVPRKKSGRHLVMPLHADIQVRARSLGLDCLTPILWHKIANGAMEGEGNGAGFYGKPYQPGGIIKNDLEYVLFLRKGGQYRKVTPLQKALSMLTKEEMQSWFVSFWTDIKGSSTRGGHPAPYPVELAKRLIRMFSFAGDTVLDPFGGTGTTSLAAMEEGRNSIYVEIEPRYLKIARSRLIGAAAQKRFFGATDASVEIP
jgi:site-specific DNA-methyltransferase (adenine-specific)